jgi:hypothetical protein
MDINLNKISEEILGYRILVNGSLSDFFMANFINIGKKDTFKYLYHNRILANKYYYLKVLEISPTRQKYDKKEILEDYLEVCKEGNIWFFFNKYPEYVCKFFISNVELQKKIDEVSSFLADEEQFLEKEQFEEIFYKELRYVLNKPMYK